MLFCRYDTHHLGLAGQLAACPVQKSAAQSLCLLVQSTSSLRDRFESNHAIRFAPHPDGDQWDTLCQAGTVLLFIAHTWPDGDETPGRIISARKATRQKRKAYEDG